MCIRDRPVTVLGLQEGYFYDVVSPLGIESGGLGVEDGESLSLIHISEPTRPY
mgnify:CR=1 FL=1